jgi:PRTRC genetic system protein E
MFKQLEELLTKASFSMTISAKDDSISVTVIPKGKNGVAISNTPLALSGTADELDEKFVPEIINALGESLGFLTNAAEFKESAKKQEAKAKEAPKAAATTGKAAPAPAATKEKPVELNADQKKAKANADKSLEAAEKAADVDIKVFHKNQTLKAYTAAKMPQSLIDELTEKFDDLIKSKKATGEAETPKSEEKDLFTPPADAPKVETKVVGGKKAATKKVVEPVVVEEKEEEEEEQQEEDVEEEQPEEVTQAAAEETEEQEEEEEDEDEDIF